MWNKQSMLTLSSSHLPDLAPALDAWEQQFATLLLRLDGCFARSEGRAQARAYVRGLLGAVERKNGWQLAEYVGQANPYRVQHLLDRAKWDAEQMRDLVRAYALEHLSDPQGVLVIDETGFVKKGTHSVGVKRQYSGTAGRVENCQVGVFLCYATAHGHTLVDRELYLPHEWADDPARRQQAQVPATHAFATKPQLAHTMLTRAL